MVRGEPIRVPALDDLPEEAAAERNYLVLERRDGDWQAIWEFEHSGRTAPLPLD